MNRLKFLIKNFVSLSSAEIITKLLSFFMMIIIARYLQETEFGIYSFAFAFTSLFAITSDIGLNTLTIREIARKKEFAPKYIGNVLQIKFLLSVISFLFLFISMKIMEYPLETKSVIYIVGLYEIINSYNVFSRSIFRAFEKMEYETFTRVIERVIVFFLVIYCIKYKYELISIVFSYLIVGIFVSIISGVIITTKFAKPRFEADVKLIKSIIKDAIPFGFTAVFIVIYFKIDTVMLSMMSGDNVVGWYNASYNIIEGLSGIIAGSISGVAFPLMAKNFKISNEKNELKNIYIHCFNLLLIIGFLISLFVTMFADRIIEVLYGSNYSNSVVALQILIWAFFIICISSISSTLLYSVNKQRIVLTGTGICAIINVFLNYLLIPYYSLNGAAISTVITEIIGLIIYYHFATKFLGMPKFYFVSTSNYFRLLEEIYITRGRLLSVIKEQGK